MPQLDVARHVEHAEGQGQHAHHRLRDDEHPPLAASVGDHAAVEPEEQHRRELQAGRDADRGSGVVRQVQDEPILRDPLHPCACERDDLSGCEQPVVAYGE